MKKKVGKRIDHLLGNKLFYCRFILDDISPHSIVLILKLDKLINHMFLVRPDIVRYD